MDAYECISTKLDVRSFSSKRVPDDVKLKVLEAGRLTGSGLNSQHWRFILVEGAELMKTLADDSTTGSWVETADFAAIILTDSTYGFHLIDAGRAAQDMQLAAWNYGVVSCIFTGIRVERLRRDSAIPENLFPGIVIGFGYPARIISVRKKNRMHLNEIAFFQRYGNRLDQSKLKET